MKRKETLNKLKQFFKEKTTDEHKTIPEDKRKGYMDGASVIMFIPKTEVAHELLVNNFEVGEERTIPKMSYNEDTAGYSKYSNEYLTRILDFLKVFDSESTTIKTGRDYPLCVENEHFKIYLAPRVSNE